MMRTAIAAALVVATLGCGSAQAGDKLGAVLGGVAVGAVGGAILGSALSARAQPGPDYDEPATVYVRPPRPRPVVVEYDDAPPPPRVRDPFDDKAFQLHMRCDDGDRHACIRFGVLIGQHRERVAAWRRSNPDFFSYEN